MKEPPRQAELPGKDKLTVPVEKKPALEQQAKVEPNPIEQLNIPAKELSAAVDSLPGAIERLPDRRPRRWAAGQAAARAPAREQASVRAPARALVRAPAVAPAAATIVRATA